MLLAIGEELRGLSLIANTDGEDIDGYASHRQRTYDEESDNDAISMVDTVEHSHLSNDRKETFHQGTTVIVSFEI